MAERINVTLGDGLYKQLKTRSEFSGASMSSIMSLAYSQYEAQLSLSNELPELVKFMNTDEFKEALKKEISSKA